MRGRENGESFFGKHSKNDFLTDLYMKKLIMHCITLYVGFILSLLTALLVCWSS